MIPSHEIKERLQTLSWVSSSDSTLMNGIDEMLKKIRNVFE